ncbi:hypothetical protein FB567DRAFT_529192 [Paraphoma chrysanthemicola]|uniref:Uncharacterized protein n=1 Tax=Paraphoma chrysanthemicola TaxID=798071 RepID=A0A8K0R310_9PLEO|nr:hypothetical protein FB567DRAFT_529192 [Paraphoma chrysanthemicola]
MMKCFGLSSADATTARCLTAMFTSLLITSATFLPLFMQFGLAIPIAQAGPVPQSLAPPPLVSGIYPDPEMCTWV